MKQFLTIGINVAKFLPAVLSGVVAVEATVGGEAPGATKKQIVIDAISAAAHVGEGIPVPEVALLSTLIDSVVSRFNASGLFTKKPASPAADGAAQPIPASA